MKRTERGDGPGEGTGISAVTFDYWNTIVDGTGRQLRDARLQAWMSLLEHAGFHVELQVVKEAIGGAWQALLQAWEQGRVLLAEDAARGAVDALGLASVPSPLRAELVEAFCTVLRTTDVPLAAGIAPCLTALREAGVHIGIICDVGIDPSTELRGFLDRHGLLELFDHWSFSDEVGACKPSPSIFHHALQGLGGVPPAEAAHVGDSRRADVAGALAAGVLAVRYRGIVDELQGPEATHVVGSHAELPAVLGLG